MATSRTLFYRDSLTNVRIHNYITFIVSGRQTIFKILINSTKFFTVFYMYDVQNSVISDRHQSGEVVSLTPVFPFVSLHGVEDSGGEGWGWKKQPKTAC
jgi:hypothetical protein